MFGAFKMLEANSNIKVKSKRHQLVMGTKPKHIRLYIGIKWKLFTKKYKVKGIQSLQAVTQETQQAAGGQAAWAIGGALVTGGLGGALAGAVLGRNKDMTVFVCKLNDGKQFAGEMKTDYFNKWNAFVNGSTLLS